MDLSSQYQTLANESKRKHVDVREAAEKAVAVLRENDASKAAFEHLQQDSQSTVPTLLQPILLASDTKNAKVIALAITCLQRLVASVKGMSQASIALVLPAIRLVSNQGVEIQLKILQTLVSLLSNSAVHGSLLADLLLMCFRLQDSKVGVVSSTAAATSRQLVMLIFEGVVAEDRATDGKGNIAEEVQLSEADEAIKLQPSAADAYNVFRDLCILVAAPANSTTTSQTPPLFLKIATLPKTFGFELIESILSDFHSVFSARHPELLHLLRSSLSPLLIRSLAGDTHPQFSTTLRLTRVIYLLLKVFDTHLTTEGEIFMQMLVKIVGPGEVEGSGGHPLGVTSQSGRKSSQQSMSGTGTCPVWMRVLALEILRGLCNDFQLLLRLWERYDARNAGSNTGVIVGMLNALSRLASERPALLGSSHLLRSDTTSAAASDFSVGTFMELAAQAANSVGGVTSSEFSLEASSMKIQCIDQLDKSEAPPIPDTYVFLLALQCLSSIATGYYTYVSPLYNDFVTAACAKDHSISPSAPPALAISLMKPDSPLRPISDMALATWPPLLFSLSFFVTTALSDQLFATVLESLQAFTAVCGMLNLSTPRDAFLASLCKFAIPPGVIANIQASQAVPTSTISSLKSLPANVLASGADALGLGSSSTATALVLSTRNLKCLESLIRLADQLAGSLGGNWFPIFEALQNADFVLTAQAGANRRQEEVEVLGHITRLFDSTSCALNDEAFTEFISSLADLGLIMTGVQMDTFGDSGLAQSRLESARRRAGGVNTSKARPTDKLFAIAKLNDVAVLNIHRLVYRQIEIGWTTVTSSVIAIMHCSHATSSVRLQAAQTLSNVLTAASSIANAGEKELQADIQRRIFDCLSNQACSTGYGSTATDVEVRRMALDSLFNILEHSGHGIECGWQRSFEILRSVTSGGSPVFAGQTDSDGQDPTSVEPKPIATINARHALLVRIAFPSLQLICTDFLSALSLSELELCVNTLAEYGEQNEDLNIAMTASNLLWQVSDHIQSKGAQQSSGEERLPDEWAQLWMLLLQRLQQLARDKRQDIRDGAIQILFRALEVHGESLTVEEWEACLWQIVLPIFDSDVASLLDASKDSKTAEVSTLDVAVQHQEGTSILLMESLTTALQNFLPSKIFHTPRFSQIYPLLHRYLKSNFLCGSDTLATASMRMLERVASITVTCTPQDVNNAAKKASLEELWTLWHGLGDKLAAVEDSSSFNHRAQAALEAFMRAVQPLQAWPDVSASVQRSKDILLVAKCILTWSRSPEYQPDIDGMTPVQNAVLKVVQNLDFRIDVVAAASLSDLAEYATLAFGAAFDVPAQPEARIRSSKITYIALHKMVMPKAASLYLQHENSATVFASGAVAQLIRIHAVPMRLKYDCPPSSKFGSDPPLWQTATIQFLRLARSCARQLDALSNQLSDEVFLSVWWHLVDCYNAALSADNGAVQTMSLPAQLQAENFDLGLLASIELDLLPYLTGKRVPDEIGHAIAATLQQNTQLFESDLPLSLTEESMSADALHRYSAKAIWNGNTSSHSQLPRERFSYWCLDLLFLVCSAEGVGIEAERQRRLSRLFLPYLLARVVSAIQSYLADAILRGKLPCSRVRRDELTYLLLKLANLRLADDLYNEAFPSKSYATNDSIRQGLGASPVAAIFHIYPLLLSILASSDQAEEMGSSGIPFRLSSTSQDLSGLPDGVELGTIGQDVSAEERAESCEGIRKMAERCLASCSSVISI